jgi:hypothetical protein
LQAQDLGDLAFELHGLPPTRGGVTRREATFSNPASANSSTSGKTVAELAFIASACALVARFQTNSPVLLAFSALSFHP